MENLKYFNELHDKIYLALSIVYSRTTLYYLIRQMSI